jgi:hypothetical protein
LRSYAGAGSDTGVAGAAGAAVADAGTSVAPCISAAILLSRRLSISSLPLESSAPASMMTVAPYLFCCYVSISSLDPGRVTEAPPSSN